MSASSQLSSRGTRTSNALFAIALALLVVATQLGNLTQEFLGWDEWTFAITGADVAKGHLPFVHMIDIKPPMIFLLFGVVILLFGRSMAAIRLMGDLFLFAISVASFFLARKVVGKWPAFAGSAVLVAMAATEFAEPTNTELPATAFMIAAMLLLTAPRVNFQVAGPAGLLISLAVLTRSNLGLVALALGLLLLVSGFRRNSRVVRWAFVAYGIGGLIPVAVLFLVYAWAGELAALKLGMIDLPVVYTQQQGVMQTIRFHYGDVHFFARTWPLIFLPAGVLAVIGFGRGLDILWKGSADHRWTCLVVLVATATVGCSLLIGGSSYPHYWIQLFPAVGFFIAIGVEQLLRMPLRYLAVLLTTLPIGAAIIWKTPSAIAVLREPASYSAKYEQRAAASYISDKWPNSPRIWALHRHLVHWYLDAPLATKAAHPDLIGRPGVTKALISSGYVPGDELQRLMTNQPDLVVTDAQGAGLRWVADAGRPINAWLETNYQLDRRFGDVLIYRRRDMPVNAP